MVVVTSDHGEQLGDQATLGKGGPFESSYHIPGIVRDPRHPEAHGTVVTEFTENVDVFPTVCDAIGIDVPAQCDGLPAHALPAGRATAVVARGGALGVRLALGVHLRGPHPWPWDRRLETKHLAVLRSESAAYVQYGDGQWRCFDLGADPGWRTEVTDPGVVLDHAQSMLTWRSRHADRTLSDMLSLRRWGRSGPRCRRHVTLPELLELLASMDGEPAEETDGLSELDHGLQCASELARVRPDDDELHLAGLVHDIGHRFGPDERHGVLGAHAVRGLLG